jgi:aspartate racemase
VTSVKNIFGIVGGMGPLASAEFLRTIYEYSLADRREQEAPAVMLYSDPTIPDRTEAFLKREDGPVLEQLTAAVEGLVGLGATRIVVCCMTIHYLLPRLPQHLRTRVISMFDIIYEQLARSPRRRLVLCSTGTRKLRLFESHSQWERLKDSLVFPDDEDQRAVHEGIIYPIKKCPDLGGLEAAQSLMKKYGVESFVAGCSEIHVLSKYFLARGAGREVCDFIDPFDALARELAEGRLFDRHAGRFNNQTPPPFNAHIDPSFETEPV